MKVAKDVPEAVGTAMWQLHTDFENEFRNREPFQPFVELANQLQGQAEQELVFPEAFVCRGLSRACSGVFQATLPRSRWMVASFSDPNTNSP